MLINRKLYDMYQNHNELWKLVGQRHIWALDMLRHQKLPGHIDARGKYM